MKKPILTRDVDEKVVEKTKDVATCATKGECVKPVALLGPAKIDHIKDLRKEYEDCLTQEQFWDRMYY